MEEELLEIGVSYRRENDNDKNFYRVECKRLNDLLYNKNEALNIYQAENEQLKVDVKALKFRLEQLENKERGNYEIR